MQNKIAVIIPNDNGEKLITETLAAVYAQDAEDFRVIVVDNGSMDRSVELIAEGFPQTEVIVNRENLGFAEAVNQAAAQCKEPYLAILHSDALPDPNWLSASLEAIESRSDIFAVTPKLILKENPSLLYAAGCGFPLSGRAYRIGSGRRAEKYRKAKKVFAPCSAAAFFRRDVFHLLGGFDKRFFLSLADAELGFRAQQIGYGTLFLPDAAVRHSGGSEDDLRARLTARNSGYLRYKNMPRLMRFCNSLSLRKGDRQDKRYYRKLGLEKSYRLGKEEAKLTRKRFYRDQRKTHGFGKQMRVQKLMLGCTWKKAVKR